MSTTIFLALLLQIGAGSNAGLTNAGFVALSERPSRADLQCANYSNNEWVVSSSDGQLNVFLRTSFESVDPLPFSFEEGPNRFGDRHIVQVADGWLVGFDAGAPSAAWCIFQGESPCRVRLSQPPVSSVA
ncbi:MAG: hypothetical protein JW976_08545, partial [Syntrophaceae bacterium]|nr:hypothetical protein [Syntrophaceae bacterium]